jgi:gamma-glutamyl phosphate reductase
MVKFSQEKEMRVNEQVVERLEKVIDTLRDNSVKMGQMLAVHDEKLTKQDRIDAVLFEKVESLHREVSRSSKEIKAGCERDIRKVDDRLRLMEKKMWTIAGAISIISFIVSPVGQRIMGTALTPTSSTTIIQGTK